MKFECKGDVFIKAVQQVARARSKTLDKQALTDIHLEVDNHLLTLRATNLELFCEKTIPVKGIVNGACLLQGEMLLRIISTFSTKDVTFSCELIDTVFSITTEKGVIEIKITPYEDFPKLPQQGNVIGSLPRTSFETLLRSVSFCSAKTDIKPEISSVYVYTKDTSIYSVATDSYRLAEKSIPNDNGLEFSFLISEKHIGDIIQILQDEDETITLSRYDNIISISGQNFTLSIHTIIGNFPDYRQLFPKEFTTTISITKDELQKALLLTTFFNDHYSQVEFVVASSICTLHSHSEKVGQVTHTLSIEKEGDDFESKYNNKFFLEVLPFIQGERIIGKVTTPARPLFIQGNQDVTFTYLLMPLNR